MGEAAATAFLQRGVNVIATSLEAEKVEFVRPEPSSSNGFLVRMNLDVTSEKSVLAALDQVYQLTDGRLDWLLNNAGYAYYLPLLDVDITKAKEQYDVNVWGVLAVTQAFFPLLRAARGTVVNQCSVSGLQGWSRPFMGVYSSSKAALLSLSDSMRVEFAPFEVKVVVLMTSAVRTEFFRNMSGGGLPESSLYFPIKAQADELMGAGQADQNGHDRDMVARSTVAELLKDDPPRVIRKGYLASVICWLHWLLPAWILDNINSNGFGLHLLRAVDTDKVTNGKSD
jgi:NAD(P)-dependent dehydrogenase (short-subunit alcohol dehydrogenase family)